MTHLVEVNKCLMVQLYVSERKAYPQIESINSFQGSYQKLKQLNTEDSSSVLITFAITIIKFMTVPLSSRVNIVCNVFKERFGQEISTGSQSSIGSMTTSIWNSIWIDVLQV